MDMQIYKNLYSSENTFVEKLSFESMFLLDDKQLCIDVNDAALKMFQYTRKELIGNDLKFLVRNEDLETLLKNRSNGITTPYEARLIRKDGTQILALIQGDDLTVENKKLRVATCRDITLAKVTQYEYTQHRKQLESIFNNNISGIVVINQDRQIIKANTKAANIVGWDHGQDLIGKEMEKFHISSESYNEFFKTCFPVIVNREIYQKEIQLVKKDGSYIWVRVSGSLINTDHPPSMDDGIAWVIDDISDIKEAETKMLQAYNELEVIFNNALVGIAVVGTGRVIYKVNQTFVDMVGGHSAEDWIGKSVREFHLSDKSYQVFGEKFYNSLVNKKILEIDYQVKGKDGKPIWVAVSGQAIDNKIPADLDKGVVWVSRDINERKSMEAKLIKLTQEDSLTGLYNRRYFIEQSLKQIELVRRLNSKLSLLMLDIDNFKFINDTHGHDIGDQALIFFSETCKESVGSSDIVGRIGGEEFVILLVDSMHRKALETAKNIQRNLEIKSLVKPFIPTMTVSIGVIEIQADESLNEAMKRVDQLLYKAKDNGRNRIESE